MDPEDDAPRGLSRRDFLKAGAAAGGFALLAGAVPGVAWAAGRRPDLSALGELVNPWDVAAGPEGAIYVANAGRYGVVRLDDGAASYLGEGAGTAPGRFNFPMGVDAAADGRVFVADTNNGRVQEFDAGGTLRRTFGRLGYQDGEFLRPKSVCVYDAGLLVADTRNHRVQYVDLGSERLGGGPVTRAMLGGLGDGPTDLKLPRYVAADAGGRIYVADAGHAVVKVFALDGRVLRVIGQGRLAEPAGIACADGGLFVADAGAASVLAFGADGRARGVVRGLAGLKKPRGLSYVDGYLLVADPAAARVFVAAV